MFYLKPPRGDILLNDLQECVKTRINYFLCKYQEYTTISKDVQFQYLTIGSAYDRTGHFMLRLVQSKRINRSYALYLVQCSQIHYCKVI